MCGIFGILANENVRNSDLRHLALHARQRGRDSSGLIYFDDKSYKVRRADYDIKNLLGKHRTPHTKYIMGHSRLITNGSSNNQPVVRDGLLLIHNGIVVNDQEIWNSLEIERNFEIDSEVILGITLQHLECSGELTNLPKKILSICQGTVSAALVIPKLGKLLLFSNNGSLYVGINSRATYFSSERFPLTKLACKDIKQIWQEGVTFDIQVAESIETFDMKAKDRNLIPVFKNIASEEAMLVYPQHTLRRCTRCILPETMPYIHFDEEGICNYCRFYKPRNKPKSKEELLNIVLPYRRDKGPDCIVPFSGGRDSCWGLHLIKNELKMKPITYTYDWGMVTDLGRRNISRVCSQLGVENIIVADDIAMKRRNIRLNLIAWLRSPNLGMISILTAGDKHFFRHVETIKNQTGIRLNLWSVNPLEVTHFKAGFLGVPPDFNESRVYMHGMGKQINYQWRRFKAMLRSPGYFNSSLLDTISGEYYRSFSHKSDYYHVFDYWCWDEVVCNDVLEQYGWELAPDTSATWRIGDGTAAFYNYLYYTIAGFTEHDTFRSNQIREGQISRQQALECVKEENQPRYQNIRWYLDAIGLDFEEVIKRINTIPRLFD